MNDFVTVDKPGDEYHRRIGIVVDRVGDRYVVEFVERNGLTETYTLGSFLGRELRATIKVRVAV